ncbi:polyamine-transporting ATPase 13A3-like isoform X2 [Corythoichthys intestinalis]|uniref:polyamine-transporting ATPase 13A3-like isoform X2 n=1 Tax=Corythoichthys intestinalis TaxID=161448 RepID=UPI0025A4F885|nr:polyamine-transporting ATPase 13A3-like isoform X2 [Corythoichthys intestinalis]
METREIKIINQGLDDEMEVFGYRPCVWKMVLVGAGSICSGGLLLLLLYWLPQWRVKATCERSPPGEARSLLLRTTDDLRQWAHVKVRVMRAPGRTPFDGVDHHRHPSAHGYRQPGPIAHHGKNGTFNRLDSTELIHYFSHHSVTYYWNEGTQDFETFKGLEHTKVSCGAIHREHSQGLTQKVRDYRSLFFGKNEMDVRVPSLFKLFVKEVLDPFYLFQLFAIILWAVQSYFLYSANMLVISCIFIGVSLYFIRKHYVKLRNLVVTHSVVRVTVCRKNKDVEEIMSTELVPGDVIALPADGLLVPCDAALICGTCVVNESMLTGESVAVTKIGVPSSGREAGEIYDTERHKRHTLFCGSRVIQSRHYAGQAVKALVVRTGFNTEKGQLVRSILYPKPTDIQLHRDAAQFLKCMVVLAGLGALYAIIIDVILGVSATAVIFDALNITLIAVPPILPVALTAGLVHAQRRMKRRGIFCISPQRINVSGQLDVICFDKTGTLTEDGLDLWGIHRAQHGIFSVATTEVSPKTSFAACMATCHSLIITDGKLCGDPLDVKVFSATGSLLEEGNEYHAALYHARISAVVQFPDQSGEFGIVRQFPFSSALRRMSVVVRGLGRKHFDVYLKGAPETVADLCAPHTVPQNFTETLETYTRQGFRVIGLAHRQMEPQLSWLQVQNLSREQTESNLDFLGLIIMQNKIKEQTADVLLDLRRADIRTLMVTGDDLSTAVWVARECGMIGAGEKVIVADAAPPRHHRPASITWCHWEEPFLYTNATSEIGFSSDGRWAEEEPGYHFAVSGRAFAVIAEHFPQLFEKFLLKATVFARMTPDQKTQLVAALQSIDYTVGMCGDGANDCGSLKKAHSGISLSELEASVASPFTSSVPDISCVTQLIRLILFCGVVLLYGVLSNYGDWQYFLVDTIMLSLIVFTMSLNPAWKKLARRSPPTALLSAPVLSSILFQIFNCLLFQFFAFFFVQQQSWYRTPQEIQSDNTNSSQMYGFNRSQAGAQYIIMNFENTSLFYVSAFQYLIVAVVFAKGKPFRRPTYKNWSFVLTCVAICFFLLFIMLYPIPAIEEVFEIASVPYDWRVTLLIIILAHAVLSFLLENLILDTLWKVFPSNPTGRQHLTNKTQMASERFFSKMVWSKKGFPVTKYKYLSLKLQEELDWPPAPSSVTYAGNPDYLVSERL